MGHLRHLGLCTLLLLHGAPTICLARPVPVKGVRWTSISGEQRAPGRSEALLRRLMDGTGVTAISAAVVQDGQIVFQRTFGLVDPKSRKPVDEATVFRGASLSKPVLAYLVMKMVDEGAIDPDRPIQEYLPKPLPEYEPYRDLAGDDRWRQLTVRLLLSHQSGFPNWRAMNRGGRLDFKASPGRQFGYSGEGYRLVQFVLETMTGKDLDSLAQEKVFGPLGMSNTGYLWARRFDGNFAVDLNTELRPLIERTRTVANSAGSLLTNASDYARFLAAVMNRTGLKPATFDAMMAPQVAVTSDRLFDLPNAAGARYGSIGLAWALGWGRFRSPAGDAIFHIGYEEGCENYAVIFQDRRTALIFLSVSELRTGISREIARELIGDVYSPFDWMRY